MERRVAALNTDKIRRARGFGALLGLMGGLAWAMTSGCVLAGLIDWMADPMPTSTIYQTLWRYVGAALPLALALGAWVGSRLQVVKCRVELVQGSATSQQVIRRSKAVFWLLYPIVSLALGAALLGGVCLSDHVEKLFELFHLTDYLMFSIFGATGCAAGWAPTSWIQHILARLVSGNERTTEATPPSPALAGWTALANIAWCVSLPTALLVTSVLAARAMFSLSDEQSIGLPLVYGAMAGLTISFGFMAFVALFTSSAERAARFPARQAVDASCLRQGRRCLALLAVLPLIWLCVLYGRDSVPLWPKPLQVGVQRMDYRANLRCWPQTNYFRLQTSASSRDQLPAIVRVERKGKGDFFVDRSKLRFEDFVLFLPDGGTNLAVSNLWNPNVRETEIGLTREVLYIGPNSKDPLAIMATDKVCYVLCTLRAVDKKNVPKGYEEEWDGSLSCRLEGYFDKLNDGIELQLYKNSIVEPIRATTHCEVIDELRNLKGDSTLIPVPIQGGQTGVISIGESRQTYFGSRFDRWNNLDDVFRAPVSLEESTGRFQAKLRITRKLAASYDQGASTGNTDKRATSRASEIRLLLGVRLRPIDFERKGETALLGRDWETAVESFSRASKAEEKNPKYAARLGAAYNQGKRHADAVEAYKKAVALSSENPSYNNGLAWSLFLADRLEDAWGTACKAVELDPKNAGSWDTYAHVAFATNRWSEAARGWDKVIELNGKLFDAKADPTCADDEAKRMKAHEEAGIPLPPLPTAAPVKIGP